MSKDDSSSSVAALFERHMQAEMDGDLEGTMATMSGSPHLNHVPVRAGGFGYADVREFYDKHLVGAFFPEGTEFTTVSRTADANRVVDELVISFTHTQAMDFMLPGVAPTGKRVTIPLVVIVGADGDKVGYEHIYWDQASVLVQIGLLDPTGLPVTGADQAEQVLDPSRPYRTDY